MARELGTLCPLGSLLRSGGQHQGSGLSQLADSGSGPAPLSGRCCGWSLRVKGAVHGVWGHLGDRRLGRFASAGLGQATSAARPELLRRLGASGVPHQAQPGVRGTLGGPCHRKGTASAGSIGGGAVDGKPACRRTGSSLGPSGGTGAGWRWADSASARWLRLLCAGSVHATRRPACRRKWSGAAKRLPASWRKWSGVQCDASVGSLTEARHGAPVVPELRESTVERR